MLIGLIMQISGPQNTADLFQSRGSSPLVIIMPPPRGHNAVIGVRRPSVCLSVCLMSRTSALTRKPKGLGRRNFAQGYPRSHATPTPTSRSKVKVTGRWHIVASTKRAATWRTAADITSLKYYLILQCL